MRRMRSLGASGDDGPSTGCKEITFSEVEVETGRGACFIWSG